MKRNALTWCVVTGITVAGMALAWAAGAAGKVTPKVSSCDSDKASLTLDIEDIPEGKSWNDLHFEGWLETPLEPPRKLPPIKGITVKDPDGKDVDLKSTKQAKTYNKKSGTSNFVTKKAQGNGKFKIEIDWDDKDKSATDWVKLKIYVTNNGSTTSYGPDDIIGGKGVIDSDAPDAPSFVATLIGPGGGSEFGVCACPIGGTITLAANASEFLGGEPYQIYSARTEDVDGFDELQIGLNNTTDPVPPAWNVTMTGTAGMLSAAGEPLMPITVSVPMQPELVGESFYVVLAATHTDTETGDTEPRMTTNVLRVEIEAP